MLTQAEPYGVGDVAALLARQLKERPRAPSVRRPELVPLDAVVLRGLERYPRKRYATAGAFARKVAEAIETVLAHEGSREIAVGLDAAPEPAPRSEGPATQPDLRAAAFTRGIVFRSVPRVLGVRAAERWRALLMETTPGLAEHLSATIPALAWLPTPAFQALLHQSPRAGRDIDEFARELGRATIRASFRRFFPASAPTLAPKRTLAALSTVWHRYQSWGQVTTKPMKDLQVAVEVSGGVDDAAICSWTRGMLEALVMLSGGADVQVAHVRCRSRNDDRCLFELAWKHSSQEVETPLTRGSTHRATPVLEGDAPTHSLSTETRLPHTAEPEPPALRPEETRTERQVRAPSRSALSASDTIPPPTPPASERRRE